MLVPVAGLGVWLGCPEGDSLLRAGVGAGEAALAADVVKTSLAVLYADTAAGTHPRADAAADALVRRVNKAGELFLRQFGLVPEKVRVSLAVGVRYGLYLAPARRDVRLYFGELLLHVLVLGALLVHVEGGQVVVRHQQRAYIRRSLAG